jgi:hypothetical protein
MGFCYLGRTLVIFMSNIGKTLFVTARDARRKTLRQRLKLVRVLKGKAPSNEYDWGCDNPRMRRPDHNDTLLITFADRPNRTR